MITQYINARDHRGQPIELFVTDGVFCEPCQAQEVIDLSGGTVLPGFVDAHCHIIPMGLDLKKLHLGPCQTKEEVLETVRDFHAKTDPDSWLHAVHYDQTKFADGQHITRRELDQISASRPILLRHSNGHASIANSAALVCAKVTDETPDPAGGTYGRDASGSLNGLLLERAHEIVTSSAPDPTLVEMVEAVLVASAKMSSLGITCASDMMTGRWNLEQEIEAYTIASKRSSTIRLRLYAQWNSLFGSRKIQPERLQELIQEMNPAKCRLAGAKIFADGAIGSATAAIYGEYLTTGGNGQLIYAPEKFEMMVQAADQAGYQLAVHTIGDRSTDLVMSAFEKTSNPTKHRIEHAMILSDDQINRMASLGSFVTMQPEFLTAFGHAYIKQLGPDRASKLKRVKSVLQAGIKLSFSSDRPIVSGDPWDGINCAVNRPSGFDQSENITLDKAIELYTSESAKANGDTDSMGSLQPGCCADFQVYSDWESKELAKTFLGGLELGSNSVNNAPVQR